MAIAARGRALAIDPALRLAALAPAPAVRAPAPAALALVLAALAPTAVRVLALALAVRALAATAAVVEWRGRARDLALLIGGASPDGEADERGIDGLPAASAGGGAVTRRVPRRPADAAQRA